MNNPVKSFLAIALGLTLMIATLMGVSHMCRNATYPAAEPPPGVSSVQQFRGPTRWENVVRCILLPGGDGVLYTKEGDGDLEVHYITGYSSGCNTGHDSCDTAGPMTVELRERPAGRWNLWVTIHGPSQRVHASEVPRQVYWLEYEFNPALQETQIWGMMRSGGL